MKKYYYFIQCVIFHTYNQSCEDEKESKKSHFRLVHEPTDHFELFEMTVQADFLAVITILLGWDLLLGI